MHCSVVAIAWLAPRVSHRAAQWAQADRAARRRDLHPKLPKREHDAPGWRAAIKALMLVVETGGPTNDGTHRRNARAARG